MAKTNNLTDFLTDVANAIREKEGSSEAINPQAFSTRILALRTGGSGGGGLVPEKDVNFRDYDGTILHSYSKDAFLALSTLPELPTRDGLVCQEWNWSYENAQSYVEAYGVLDIGATYITDDGKTRLYITIDNMKRSNIPIAFKQSVENGVIVDWGDGSDVQTYSSTSVAASHQYEAVGDYIITLEVTQGTLTIGGSSSTSMMGAKSNTNNVYAATLTKVECGSSVSITSYAFQYCTSLRYITISSSTSTSSYSFYYCRTLPYIVLSRATRLLGTYSFNYCSSLSGISLPDSITSVGSYAFYYCRALMNIIFPGSLTKIENNALQYCEGLLSVTMPDSLTTIGNNTFQYCHSLRELSLPSGLTSLGSISLNGCYVLSSLFIPKGVKSIAANTFGSCYGIAYYDFRTHESIPSLANSNAFGSRASDCVIIVPDNLYDSWIAATNWSGLASIIIKASEFNG